MNRSLTIGAACAMSLCLVTLSAQAALIDRGGGLIYDDVLDVTWLQDANYARTNGDDGDGLMTWAEAKAWAENLTYYDPIRDVTYDDWRLPAVSPVDSAAFNLTLSTDGTTDKGYARTTTDGTDGGWRDSDGIPVSEMGHMYYVNLANLGACDPDLPWCTPQPGSGLVDTGPFINIEISEDYWTGTELDATRAWYFVTFGGTQFEITKTFPRFAWAVRDGDVGGTPPPPPPPPVEIDVPFASPRPFIDGVLDYGEWEDAERLDLANGFMAFLYDDERLYVLIDVLADDGDDPFVDGGGDQFWLYFDVNEDEEITPDLDLRYRLASGTGNLRYQTFCEDCLFGFNSLASRTFSSRGEGFGCFIDDGSVNFFPLRCNSHRVWELAIDLDEIDMRGDLTARMGYLVSSLTPFLAENHPADLNDMGSYVTLALGSFHPRSLSSSGPGAMNPSFEVTQAVQTPRNDLDLAAGKPTAVRIWDPSNEATVKNFIYGARDGVDLPGSPLLDVSGLYSSYASSGPRDTIVWNSFTTLPASWSAGGTIDFEVVIQGRDESHVATLDATVVFAPTRKPVFWTVPIRNNFPEGAFTLVAENRITLSEQTLQSDAPIREIQFVRRPILDVINVSSSADLKEDLKTYDQQVILAWTLGLLFTGQPPFDLPEQITGFIANGFGNTAGSSDRVGRGGDGRITWASPNGSGASMLYPHELNHNLDAASTSTWGLHSRGCNAASGGALDPMWPYGNSFRIQEVGVRWNGMQFNSVSDQTPDFMSYCSASGNPRQWFSPYRWQAWVDTFRTDNRGASSRSMTASPLTGNRNELMLGRGPSPVESFYVLGRIYPDGGGELGQVLRQPGLPPLEPATGDYTVRVLDCGGAVVAQDGVSPTFADDHAAALEHAAFSVILPAPSSACAIELGRGGKVIDRRAISANAPFVDLVSPNGGELWSTGTETVRWQAGDVDGDPLRFTLLYSPDGGMTWQPLATGIETEEYAVDVSGLPGSEDARLRVLATDGIHTGEDDSDASFTVARKPPAVEIVAPADNAIVEADEPLTLQGLARDTLGLPLAGDRLVWYVDGEIVGQGNSLRVNLDPADHLIELTARGDDDMLATAAVSIMTADPGGIADGKDLFRSPLDISNADTFLDGDLFVCEIVVRSVPEGLAHKSGFTCRIDFDDLEQEARSHCDADEDGSLSGSYRLGSNGECATSDMALTYRHGANGNACDGARGVVCWTEEFVADGAHDAECDGTVGGQPADGCRIRIGAPLAVIAVQRDAQCADPEDGCLGGVDGRTGAYRAYATFEAFLGQYRDQAPNTDDGGLPSSIAEALLVPLAR